MLLVHEVEIVKVASHFLGGVHACPDLKFLSVGEGRKYGGQSGMLNRLGECQFGIDPRLGVGDIAFQGIHRGVDVIGQRGKFLVGADIHHGVQFAVGNLRQF